MAYIIKRKNREGIYYVYLIESFREKDKVKNRTLKSYGRYDKMEEENPGTYDRLREEAKQGKLGDNSLPKELNISFNTETGITEIDKSYGWKLFESLFESLNIEKAIKDSISDPKMHNKLTDITKLLIYQRILNPGSKLYTLKEQEKMLGDWNIDENSMYRSLSKLATAKDKIQLDVHKSITKLTGRTGLLVFYDVTNYYFEIDHNDSDELDEDTGEIVQGFRKKGPCKHKSGNPIVQLGMFMDTNGIPISYKLFRGNFTDPVTYIPAIEDVKQQFGLERIVVVADKAMNSTQNISETFQNGDGWLFSQKHRGKRGASKSIQDFILDEKGWLYNETETFASKSMIHKRFLKSKKIYVEEKVLVTWNKKYAIREKIRRDGALEYASKLTNAELFRQTSKKGGKKYLELSYCDESTGEVKPFSPLISLDKEQVDFDEQFDGVNVIVTSEIHMSDEEMMSHYKELNKIEDCFRVTKTEMDSRPVYVRLEEHIEAHFLTCFLALVFIRMIQHKTNWMMSPRRLINAFNSAIAFEIKTGVYYVQASEDLKELLKVLNINWDNSFVRYEDLNNFAKGWCTTN